MANNTIMPRLGRVLDKLFEQVERDFDKLFEQVERDFDLLVEQSTTPARPAWAIKKRPNVTTIQVEVPGCTHKDVRVDLADSILTVRAPTLSGDRTYKFGVDSKVDSSAITATVANGLLTLVVKRDDQPAPPSGSVKVTQS